MAQHRRADFPGQDLVVSLYLKDTGHSSDDGILSRAGWWFERGVKEAKKTISEQGEDQDTSYLLHILLTKQHVTQKNLGNPIIFPVLQPEEAGPVQLLLESVKDKRVSS